MGAGIALGVAAGLMAPAGWAGESPAAIPDSALSSVKELQKRALAGSGAYEVVESLTTQVGPRLPGTPNDAAAVAWAVKTMKDLGLQNVHTEAVPMPGWRRGLERASLLSPMPQPIAVAALGASVGTGPEGLEAEVVRFANLAELQAAPAGSLTGKIAYIALPMARTQDGSGYGEAVAMRIAGPAAAAKKGAVAVLIRSVGTDAHRLPHTGMTRYEEGVPKIPAGAISTVDAAQLDRLLTPGPDNKGPVRMKLVLDVAPLDPITTYSVVGDLKGTEKPDEIVLVGAHLDSWDLGTGAIDDGAGVAIALASAKLIKGLPEKPKRTLRVVLFAAEEEGTYGAIAYGKAHAAEADRYVLGTEADLGIGPVWQFKMKANANNAAALATIATALQPLRIVKGRDDEEGESSDLGPMAKAGMPVAELSLDATTYFDIHHTADDTLDRVDRATIDQSTAAYASVLWLAMQASGTFREPATREPASH
ncbi:M20/M25/M40 family metallo-hydrolase [Nitrospirillum sp. BR 11828]|uniref:M20/M25/M40 family metallo-hydrolase n=1 Tax=Nitrospirillum sp. BR 11828 TaxID=3104325 RepID=UPI002ACAF672|nr:M20/M25/M40 family metallo-hydrolase [Nitrospirillum sp. BR 11828]MDZ5647940.1 M20/M25/M40 family metallo-hydrolase [Nitrospirillum sp. BR 11828]